MVRFNISAPGTVMLQGDLKGCNETCVIASLDKRTTLIFTSLQIPETELKYIEINFSSINLYIKIPLHIFINYFYEEKISIDEDFKNMPSIRRLHTLVKYFIDSLNNYSGTYERNNPVHKLSLQAFFFLLVLIDCSENIFIDISFTVELSTKLVIGEGLGSSTSFIICLAGCFVYWSLLQKNIVISEFRRQDLYKISYYTYICDLMIFNSLTSMLSTMSSTFGFIQVFDRRKSLSYSYSNLTYMRGILVFSKVSVKTIAQSVRLINSSVCYILNIINATSKMFAEILDHMDKRYCFIKNMGKAITNDPILMKNYERLLNLIHMNHGLLQALDMSHPNLDIICAIAQKFSLAGKVAGNHQGGYAFILLLPDTTDEQIESLINELALHNFIAEIIDLNCNGVRIES